MKIQNLSRRHCESRLRVRANESVVCSSFSTWAPNVRQKVTWSGACSSRTCNSTWPRQPEFGHSRLQTTGWSDSELARLRWRVSPWPTKQASLSILGCEFLRSTALFHPPTLLFGLLASYLMIYLLNWWPQPDRGIYGYFRPIPAIPCVFVPILALFDW